MPLNIVSVKTIDDNLKIIFKGFQYFLNPVQWIV